jgi:predicted nucleic acid-binding protein
MKGFFDTSVLVPVFYGDHVHHQASLQLFIQFDKTTGCCGAHSLAEILSTLTRMPGKHRISGEQAMLFVGSLCERLSLVALDGEEYARALGASASLGIRRGHLRRYACPLRRQSKSRDHLHLEWPALCAVGPEVIRRLQTP